MAAQADNPDFRFLFDLTLPEHAYYRWRLFSLASGDSMRSWHVEPFTFVEGGPRHAPAPLHCLQSVPPYQPVYRLCHGGCEQGRMQAAAGLL